jgi:UDP-N-acetylglucosamine 4,6-dehydratase
MFDNSTIFVSGATGSWGQTLITLLLANYNVKKIICFSRGELQQVLTQRKFNNPKLKFVIGDIRDYESVRLATKNVDYIFHLAALKHVPVCETNVQETIKTNILGTTNIVNAAIENRVKKVIDVSSDKAVEPINLYGMTKAVGEKIIIQANDLTDYTKFVCIRGGNVMGSSGSVIPLFINQIKDRGPITITDSRMTRFFLTLEEAILLLFKASIDSIGGETFVMNMPACYIKDLAEVLMDEYGTVEIKETGMRPGEKLDEMLISHHESQLTYCYDDHYFVTLPSGFNQSLATRYQNRQPFPYNDFSSKVNIMNKTQIKEMLKKGKFL